MIALCCRCDTVSVLISAGDESARPVEGLPAPKVPADAVRNPAQVSFWLLEPVADAAMTYFYAQLFAMDTEIRAMFPAAMDLHRRRFFEALGRIADAQQGQADRDRLVPYLQELGRAHRKFGVRELRGVQARPARDAAAVRRATLERDREARLGDGVHRAATIMIEAAKDDAAESPAYLFDRERPAARRAAPAARARGFRRAGQPGSRAPGPGRRPARARRARRCHDRRHAVGPGRLHQRPRPPHPLRPAP